VAVVAVVAAAAGMDVGAAAVAAVPAAAAPIDPYIVMKPQASAAVDDPAALNRADAATHGELNGDNC